jgi:hypothetical protein
MRFVFQRKALLNLPTNARFLHSWMRITLTRVRCNNKKYELHRFTKTTKSLFLSFLSLNFFPLFLSLLLVLFYSNNLFLFLSHSVTIIPSLKNIQPFLYLFESSRSLLVFDLFSSISNMFLWLYQIFLSFALSVYIFCISFS